MTPLSKLEIAEKIFAETRRELEYWQAQLNDAISRSNLAGVARKNIAVSRSNQWEKIHHLECLMREALNRWNERSKGLNQAVRIARKELRIAEEAGRARSTLATRNRAVAAAEESRNAARKRRDNYVARSKQQLLTWTQGIPDEEVACMFPSRDEARKEINALQQDVSKARSDVAAARAKVLFLRRSEHAAR